MECEKCLSMLSDYIDDMLTEHEADQVRNHVEQCPDCREELEQLEKTVALLNHLPRLTAPDEIAQKIQQQLQPSTLNPFWRSRYLVANLAVAATLLLTVFIWPAMNSQSKSADVWKTAKTESKVQNTARNFSEPMANFPQPKREKMVHVKKLKQKRKVELLEKEISPTVALATPGKKSIANNPMDTILKENIEDETTVARTFGELQNVIVTKDKQNRPIEDDNFDMAAVTKEFEEDTEEELEEEIVEHRGAGAGIYYDQKASNKQSNTHSTEKMQEEKQMQKTPKSLVSVDEKQDANGRLLTNSTTRNKKEAKKAIVTAYNKSQQNYSYKTLYMRHLTEKEVKNLPLSDTPYSFFEELQKTPQRAVLYKASDNSQKEIERLLRQKATLFSIGNGKQVLYWYKFLDHKQSIAFAKNNRSYRAHRVISQQKRPYTRNIDIISKTGIHLHVVINK